MKTNLETLVRSNILTFSMVKALGFSQGQAGDLIMNLIACRAFKRDYPDSFLTFGLNKKYAELIPILSNNPLIDDFHIHDRYNGWPSTLDENSLRHKDFDFVFHPMPKTNPFWYLERHQTEEVCLMHGLKPPDDLQITLNQDFEVKRWSKHVAVNMSAATTSAAPKTPTFDLAYNYCKMLEKMGYTPVQIGLPSDIKFCKNERYGSFFETVKFALGCDFVLTVDSAIAWIMSGYKKQTLGLYNFSYYAGAKTAQNWMPLNNNALYLEEDCMEKHTIENVAEKIKELTC